MANAHKGQAVLAAEIDAAKDKVTVGATYRHYKSRDNTYTVLGLGVEEATDEVCVLYQAQYGERLTFVRPLRVWLKQVEYEGKIVPRFEKI